jgi:uncharacterized protein
MPAGFSLDWRASRFSVVDIDAGQTFVSGSMIRIAGRQNGCRTSSCACCPNTACAVVKGSAMDGIHNEQSVHLARQFAYPDNDDPREDRMTQVSFRFFAELNDFLPPAQRQQRHTHACSRDATVKHMIEALGVPHTEVDMILVNGEPVDFAYRLQEQDQVSVYPPFSLENIPVGSGTALRPKVPDPPRFIADAHLGQLAKYLRMLGFDALYRNDYDDAEVAGIAAMENRIVLTRDRDLLIRKEIVHGCYLHSVDGDEQIAEVVARYRLASSARALTRCLGCNGLLRMVDKSQVEHRVPTHSRLAYDRFFECEACMQVYWEGSHVTRMRQRVAAMLSDKLPP